MLVNVPTTAAKHDFDRRWISDDYFDLVVWYESGQKVHGFQLCYNKSGNERALTWIRNRGFVHTAIDSGESTPTANRTPILVADGAFPFELIISEFIARGKHLPAEIRDLVLTSIKDYESHESA
jgi:hypothetical protein